MKNQFFYTRTEYITTPTEIEGESLTEEKTFTDSFNVDKIIRSVMLNENDLVVLLNDIHERTREIPNINIKTNKVNGIKKVTEVFQSEIHLHGKDIERFQKLTAI